MLVLLFGVGAFDLFGVGDTFDLLVVDNVGVVACVVVARVVVVNGNGSSMSGESSMNVYRAYTYAGKCNVQIRPSHCVGTLNFVVAESPSPTIYNKR